MRLRAILQGNKGTRNPPPPPPPGRPSRIRQISRSHFLKHNLDISPAYPSSILFLIIFGEVVPIHQNKLKVCFEFDQSRTWRRYLKLAFSAACTSTWRLWKLFHPVKQWLKQFLRDHWSFTTVQGTFFKSENGEFGWLKCVLACWNKPIKSENQIIVRCKQPIKTEKPLQCLSPFSYSVGAGNIFQTVLSSFFSVFYFLTAL